MLSYQQKGSQRKMNAHQLSPRIIFKALNAIRGRETGLYEKYGSELNFRNSFMPETGLPQYEDVYG